MNISSDQSTVTMSRKEYEALKIEVQNLQLNYKKFNEDLVQYFKESISKMGESCKTLSTLFDTIDSKNNVSETQQVTTFPTIPKSESVSSVTDLVSPTTISSKSTSFSGFLSFDSSHVKENVTFIFKDSPKKYVIDKDVIARYPSCLFNVLANEPKCYNQNHEIHIDHSDENLSYIFDFMTGKSITFDKNNEDDLFKLSDDFIYFSLPLPVELESKRTKLSRQREWLWDKSVDINGNIYKIRNYDLESRNIHDSYFQKPIDEDVDFNSKTHVYTVYKNVRYFDIIYEYIVTGNILMSKPGSMSPLHKQGSTTPIEEVDKNVSSMNTHMLVDYDHIDFERLENEFHIFSIQPSEEVVKQYFTPYAFKTSKILNTQIGTILTRWLGADRQWTLLYRASENGYKGSEFHKICDNKGPTVTIIRTNNNGHKYILGGYASSSWTSSGKWEADSNAFIFTLTNPSQTPLRFMTKDPKNSLYCNDNCGPSFGLGCDIYISDESNQTNYNYIHFPYGYGPDRTGLGWKLFLEDKGEDSYYFTVDDIEVYALA